MAKKSKKSSKITDDAVPYMHRIKEMYPRAYEPWDAEEIEELLEGWRFSQDIEFLASEHQRTEGAIRSQLAKLGMTELLDSSRSVAAPTAEVELPTKLSEEDARLIEHLREGTTLMDIALQMGTTLQKVFAHTAALALRSLPDTEPSLPVPSSEGESCNRAGDTDSDPSNAEEVGRVEAVQPDAAPPSPEPKPEPEPVAEPIEPHEASPVARERLKAPPKPGLGVDAVPKKVLWTASQERARRAFAGYLLSSNSSELFLLRGSAGTGKSTLVAELVQLAKERDYTPVLLATTGRASRILERFVKGHDASTVHGHIYNLKTLKDKGLAAEEFVLRFGLKSNEESPRVVFFIDEASMLSDVATGGQGSNRLEFGTGRTLSDFLSYIKEAVEDAVVKVVFIGDHCQLPPVVKGRKGNEVSSPALDSHYLKAAHGYRVHDYLLSEVVRQKRGSSILAMAESLRTMIEQQALGPITWFEGEDLAISRDRFEFKEAIANAYQTGRSAHVICYTNKVAHEWNSWIRSELLDRPSELSPGDRIIIQENHRPTGMKNGDFAEVLNVGDGYSRTPKHDHELRYREVTLEYEGDSGLESWTGLLLETVLSVVDGGISPEVHRARCIALTQDYPELRRNSQAFKDAMLDDIHWNALTAKYGYATTCHKAQGGEWDQILLHHDTRFYRDLRGYRWLYTAVTRCRGSLTVLDPPR